MTKSEYMKKLSYSLRRLPKEDFNQAIDYFEEYFAEAGEENEQQAIEDLGSPEDAAKELIMNLAEKNMEQPPKTVKHSFKAVWIGILFQNDAVRSRAIGSGRQLRGQFDCLCRLLGRHCLHKTGCLERAVRSGHG